MRYREPAICLRTTDFSETSQVVHFLARNYGQVKLMAKGTKRPKSKSGGAIDLLSEGDLVFIATTRDTLGTLVEFTESFPHTSLRADSDRLNTALYLIELAGLLVAEADPHPEVFDLLHNALARLGQADAPLAAVLAFYQWRLLRRVGLLGGLEECTSCGNAIEARGKDVYFSSRQGGMICGACEGAAAERYRLDGPTHSGLAALAALEKGAKVALDDKQAAGVNRLLAYHVTQQLGKTPRMLRHVLGAKRGTMD